MEYWSGGVAECGKATTPALQHSNTPTLQCSIAPVPVGSSRGLRGSDFPALSSAMAFDSVPSPSDGFFTLSLEKGLSIEACLSLSFSAFTN
jgi:hypothetical protein